MHAFRMVIMFHAATVIRMRSMVFNDLNGGIPAAFRVFAGLVLIASIPLPGSLAVFTVPVVEHAVRVAVNELVMAP